MVKASISNSIPQKLISGIPSVKGQSAATCVGTHDGDSVLHTGGVPFYAGAGIKSPPGRGGGPARRRLPPGHRFFADRDRETVARFIDWSLRRSQMANEGSWFTTLTFRDYVTPYRANKMVRRWLARLNQALESNGGSQLKSILATEWQQREVIHYHLLLAGHGLDALSRKRWECRWTALGGGFARVYDADMKAAPYLAKYLNKRLGGEVDIGGAWQGMNSPESVSVAALAGL